MASYVVMVPPARSGDEIRFVRDGFALPALILPVLWLLWHRLWIEALLVFAAAILLAAIGEIGGWTVTTMLLSFLISIYVAMEGSALRQWALRRRGWRESAVVEAADEDEAMTRYFADDEHVADYEASRPVSRPTHAATVPVAGAPALGLLSYPTKH